LVDKEAGPTAHDVVSAVRRLLGIRRVGHSGTLDPFATGLLVMLVGRATRLSQFLTGLPKSYSGTIRLGQTTDTDDRTGQVTARKDCEGIEHDRIRSAMDGLTGRYDQSPPAYSARKVDGQRAYRRARGGETFELKATEVEVHSFNAREISGTDISFDCRVSGGTYVRSLARDLGDRLGCGAHLHALRREAVGGFRVEDAVQLEEIGSDTVPGPAAGLLAHLAAIELDDDARLMVSHGRPIEAGEVGAGPFALTAGGELVAVAVREDDLLKPRVVLQG
jgi:tRNA pseudouridine55 synthase